jgi:hypothetical protein
MKAILFLSDRIAFSALLKMSISEFLEWFYLYKEMMNKEE